MSYLGNRRGRRSTSVGRPRRRNTTIKLQDKATFRGNSYSVYSRRGGEADRVIFSKDSEVQSNRTPIGAKFRVTYLGRNYTAQKSLRMVRRDNQTVTAPVLEWTLEHE